MREEFFSRFGKPQVAAEKLQRYVKFLHTVAEFCATTKLKVAYANEMGDRVWFHTANGFYGGDLQFLPNGTMNDRSKPRYIYTGPFVHKEKASANSNRNQRDSEKITGILSALRRNEEIPEERDIFSEFMPGISYGFNSCTQHKPKPSINLDSDETYALIEFYLNNNPTFAAQHRNRLESKYESYLDELDKIKDAKANLTRFAKGSKIIGIIPDPAPTGVGAPDYYYVVGEAMLDGAQSDAVVLQSPLERYDSLSTSPVAADAAIIRTYTTGKSWFAKDNELGIPMGDKYYEDIDVGVGYASHETGWWVVIPNNAS